MGQDPVEVCRYFAARDCINHVHFRNVKVMKPYERYQEVFIDEGLNNMFAVMRELVRNKYTHIVYPEHPRALDYDRSTESSAATPAAAVTRRSPSRWATRAP
jgi:mannonate dehydratase